VREKIQGVRDKDSMEPMLINSLGLSDPDRIRYRDKNSIESEFVMKNSKEMNGRPKACPSRRGG